jgi:hypothetical protein
MLYARLAGYRYRITLFVSCCEETVLAAINDFFQVDPVRDGEESREPQKGMYRIFLLLKTSV